jgi:hypothetical protein
METVGRFDYVGEAFGADEGLVTTFYFYKV